jgi:hypothetical protein
MKNIQADGSGSFVLLCWTAQRSPHSATLLDAACGTGLEVGKGKMGFPARQADRGCSSLAFANVRACRSKSVLFTVRTQPNPNLQIVDRSFPYLAGCMDGWMSHKSMFCRTPCKVMNGLV